VLPVYILLTAASLILSRRLYHTVLSPIGIFGAIWNGLLTLFEARLLNYDPLNSLAHAAFIGSFLLFVGGVLMATVLALPFKYEESPIPALNLRRMRHVLDLLNALSLLGLLLRVFQLIRLVGVGATLNTMTFRGNVAEMGTGEFGGGLVGYSLALLPLAGIVGGIYLAEHPSGRLRGLSCLVISAGSSLLTGSRALFIWTLLLFAAAYVLTRVIVQRQPASRVLRPLAAAGAGLFLVFAIVGTLRRAEFAPLQESEVNVRLPRPVLQAYHYMTSGFGAFSVHIKDPVQIDLPGIHTIQPLVRAIARLIPKRKGFSYEFLVHYSTQRDFVSIPQATNVFTYLAAFFDDLGWAGILGMSLVIGFLSGFTFQKLYTQSGFKMIALYSLFCLQFMFASISPITNFNSILLTILGVFVLNPYLSRKEDPDENLLPVADASGGPR